MRMHARLSPRTLAAAILQLASSFSVLATVGRLPKEFILWQHAINCSEPQPNIPSRISLPFDAKPSSKRSFDESDAKETLDRAVGCEGKEALP